MARLNPIITLIYTTIQKKAAKLLASAKIKYLLLYGGSRSGKTVEIIEYILIRCLKYPGSKHAVARFSLANARKTIWKQTILPMIKPYEKRGLCKINLSDASIEFSNGSSIQLFGLQPDQIDSILGSEFASIFVNEANENRWSAIELLFSRLNDKAVDAEGNEIKLKFIADLNPTSLSSWDYKFFHLKQNPESGEPHPEADRIEHIRLNPYDNKENLAGDYLQTLEGLGETKRKRFLYGEYGNYSGLVYDLPQKYRSIDIPVAPFDVSILGLDFGHKHPSVFSCIRTNGEKFLTIEEFYKKGMTTPKIIEKITELDRKHHFNYFFCDGSRPEIIEEIVNAGFPAEPAVKGQGSVFAGIMFLTGLIETGNYLINGTACPMHLAEFDSYRWDDKIESREVPVKMDDDCMDANRYGIYSYVQKFGDTATAEKLLDVQSSF